MWHGHGSIIRSWIARAGRTQDSDHVDLHWDAKDARDGEGSITRLFGLTSQPTPRRGSPSPIGEPRLEKSGGFLKRDRWDWGGFREQTSSFVRLAPDGAPYWGFKGKHGRDITAGVGLEDIRWLLPYLSRIPTNTWNRPSPRAGVGSCRAKSLLG